MSRTRELLLAGLFSAIAIVGVTGCDLATSSTSGQGSNLHVAGGTEGTLPVAEGEPILSADGVFELYYAADEFGDSACVSAWVRNTGPTLSTWKISVGLDRAIVDSTYSGAGANLVFLYERELVVVPSDATKLRSGDVVSIRYCAEPISLPVDVVVTSGASEGSVVPGDGPAAPVLSSGDFTLYQSVANDWETGGCVQVAMRNGGPAVTAWALRLELDQPLESLSSQWGAILQPAGGALLDVFATNNDQPLAKGGSVSFGYCAEPLAYVKSITSLTFDLVPTDLTEPQANTFTAGQVDDPGLGVSLRYGAPTSAGDGVGCYDVIFTNTGSVDLPHVSKFVVATFGDFELKNLSWHAAIEKSATAELTFQWPATWGAMKKGKEYRGNVCLKPVQKPYVLYVIVD